MKYFSIQVVGLSKLSHPSWVEIRKISFLAARTVEQLSTPKLGPVHFCYSREAEPVLLSAAARLPSSVPRGRFYVTGAFLGSGGRRSKTRATSWLGSGGGPRLGPELAPSRCTLTCGRGWDLCGDSLMKAPPQDVSTFRRPLVFGFQHRVLGVTKTFQPHPSPGVGLSTEGQAQFFLTCSPLPDLARVVARVPWAGARQ